MSGPELRPGVFKRPAVVDTQRNALSATTLGRGCGEGVFRPPGRHHRSRQRTEGQETSNRVSRVSNSPQAGASALDIRLSIGACHAWLQLATTTNWSAYGCGRATSELQRVVWRMHPRARTTTPRGRSDARGGGVSPRPVMGEAGGDALSSTLPYENDSLI